MAKIKLFHVTTIPISLFFYSGHISFLRKNGFEVHGVSSPGLDLARFAEKECAAVHSVNMVRQPSPRQDLASLFGLFRLFKREKPDIVHLTTPKAGLLGALAARMAGIDGVLLSVFGLAQMTKTGLMRKFLDMMTKTSCKLSNLVWCDSFSMREHLITTGLCPARKVVVFGKGSVNGIQSHDKFNPDKYDYQLRKKIREELKIPLFAPVIGFIGRIVNDKGMRELALAWRELRLEFPDLHLLMAGFSEPSDPLSIDDEKLFQTDSRVHLTGWRNDVPELLSSIDIFVNPSYREGFGIANLEASAMRLPVVSTLIPGCVDSVKNGETGILVPPGNSEALKETLILYLRDPELGKTHGRNGRERVLRDFRLEIITKDLYNAYLKIISHRYDRPAHKDVTDKTY